MLGTINIVILDGTGIHALNELWTLLIILFAVWGVIAIPVLLARGAERRRLRQLLSENTGLLETLTRRVELGAPPPPPPPT